ncbi:hypothetical protein AO377_1545 [Moraxella catarrhalis]|uniref:hypothetical protein n=1 Tax=Moraxella catarrhalis TaxID=480 RepID=UPI0007F4B2E3|nr:hypothetical protein [Moraxella catarrhalis]OAV05691.1 hypothetical protein AO379_1421 [Moraxella catarrhalis]OAV08885.1 hypothetical protein AO377_1545 [Moraxella catarrhalis]OAV12783.1 hypothetical protein AO375_1757 [Moraxella catarrhalis]OAV38249.1 hypothetical protein AO365_0093 [Moraxella catarrhalis]
MIEFAWLSRHESTDEFLADCIFGTSQLGSTIDQKHEDTHMVVTLALMMTFFMR